MINPVQAIKNTPNSRLVHRLNMSGVVFFLLLWIVAMPTGWIHSVTFVSHVSMATAVFTCFAAWCSSRVEVKQEEAK